MPDTGAPQQDNADTSSSMIRPALAVQLADALREMILEGDLKGGEKVNEKFLTEKFGVSRTPLREAMKVIAAEGMIDLIPNRGAVVSSQTDKELADAFPILAALEGIAGAQAAERASDEQIEEIVQLTDRMRVSFEEGNRPQYFVVNQAIHAAILGASGNETLQRTHATVAMRVHRARYQANLTPTRWQKAMAEHQDIANALTARDAGKAHDLIRDHLMGKLKTVVAARKSDT